MTLCTKIEDGLGTGKTAQVTPRNSVLVQVAPVSAAGLSTDDLTSLRLKREYFTDSAGSEAMNVDGSTTPVEFSIESEVRFTKWVTAFRLQLEGTNLDMSTQDFRRFGAATSPNNSLTNGIDIFSVQSGETIDIAVEPIAFAGDFFDYADEYLNLANSIATNEDFLQFRFTLDKPIILPAESADKLVIRINDDLTAIDKIVAIARGYKEAT